MEEDRVPGIPVFEFCVCFGSDTSGCPFHGKQCQHNRLNEDGICHSCGKDCRGEAG